MPAEFFLNCRYERSDVPLGSMRALWGNVFVLRRAMNVFGWRIVPGDGSAYNKGCLWEKLDDRYLGRFRITVAS